MRRRAGTRRSLWDVFFCRGNVMCRAGWYKGSFKTVYASGSTVAVSLLDASSPSQLSITHAPRLLGARPQRSGRPHDASFREASPCGSLLGVPRNDPVLHTGMGRGFLDGSLGSRTAALVAPYSDDRSNSGIPLYEQGKLDQMQPTRSLRKRRKGSSFRSTSPISRSSTATSRGSRPLRF
jgi:hypothetical protein